MAAEASEFESLLAAPPRGFEVVSATDDCVEISQRNTGMACLNVFLVVWIAGWTAGACGATWEYLTATRKEVTIYLSLFMWVTDLLVAAFAGYVMFATRRYRLSSDSVELEIRCLGLTWKRSLEWSQIGVVRQVKDGGEQEDSFPSWGLRLESRKAMTLIYRQPYASSLWLGQLIALWSGKPFNRVRES